jgi:hypothetical protein
MEEHITLLINKTYQIFDTVSICTPLQQTRKLWEARMGSVSFLFTFGVTVMNELCQYQASTSIRDKNAISMILQ